jgi:hypothetical protein
MAVTKQLEAQIAAVKARDAAGLLLSAPITAGEAAHAPAIADAPAAADAVTGGPIAGGAGNRGNGYADIGNVPVPKADVLVTVPVFALLGLTDEPANLDGHGPIPASMARELAANGANSFYRALVDPKDGAPLEIGRTN